MLPVVGASMPVARLMQGRLAGPVGADEADDVAGRDAERAVGQRPAPPVLLAQAAGLNRGGHTASS